MDILRCCLLIRSSLISMSQVLPLPSTQESLPISIDLGERCPEIMTLNKTAVALPSTY